MKFSIDELENLSLRKRRLLGRIEEIAGSMTGETASVRDLFCSEDGSFDPERVRMLCDQLVDCMDTVQKVAWLGVGHNEMLRRYNVARGIKEFGASYPPVDEKIVEWYTKLSEIEGLADIAEAGFDVFVVDLQNLPTTFAPKQQRLVRAFVWCVVHAISYFDMPSSVEIMRDLAHRTSRLIGDAAGHLEPDIHKLTREFLLKSGLMREASYGLASGQNNLHLVNFTGDPLERSLENLNIFVMMDVLYATLTGSSVATLEPEEVVQAFKNSEYGAAVYERYNVEKEIYEAAHLAVFAQRSMWTLPDLYPEPTLQLELKPGEVLHKVLDDLPTYPDKALDNLPVLLRNDDSVITRLLGAVFDKGSVPWSSMSREARVDTLRAAFSHAASWIDAYELDANGREYYWLAGVTLTERDAPGYPGNHWNEWAAKIGGTDELFEQYRVLRSCIRGLDALERFNDDELVLPPGHPSGIWGGFYYLPTNFDELFDMALDMLLIELGVSHYADDQVYHRTYAYLGETRYQMNRLIEGE